MKDKHFDIIHRFLEGELEGEELKEFEANLKLNPELSAELELQKKANEFLDFQKTITNIEKSLKQEKFDVKSIRKIKYWTWVAASVAVVVIGYFVLSFNQPMSNEKIFAEYYNFVPSDAIGRDCQEGVSILVKGLEEYDKHNYKIATDYLNKALITDPDNIYAHFYLSMISIETNKYQEAINKLKEISSKEFIYIDENDWYMALCYIKLENNDEAIKILTRIIESDNVYKENAKKILKEIEK